MRKLLVAVAVWYFIYALPSGVVQVGPFATQAACNNFSASLTTGPNGQGFASACFRTTAKQ
jgi:hypothetical protein